MNRKTNIMYIIVIGHFVKVIYINSWISYAIDICKSIQKYAKWNNSLNNIDWTVKYNEINYAIEYTYTNIETKRNSIVFYGIWFYITLIRMMESVVKGTCFTVIETEWQ